jgi:hypothetical protein
MNIKTTNLRLNLEKSDHRKAYEILKNADTSYTKTIVAALIAYAENENYQTALLEKISEIVRNEIGGTLKKCDFTQIGESAETEKVSNPDESKIAEKPNQDALEKSESDENDDSVDMDFLDM